jgi:hypothetical protein
MECRVGDHDRVRVMYQKVICVMTHFGHDTKIFQKHKIFGKVDRLKTLTG